jgi:putative ABC transport system permease protein
VQTLMQDIRFGVRMLIKNPAVTFVAVVTLALGIGANTAIFSAINGLLLRPLPVENADRLTVIAGQTKGLDGFDGISYRDYHDLREQARGFSDLLAYNLNVLGLEADGKTDMLIVSYVSSNYFSGLGLKPAQGRLLYGDDVEKKGNEPQLVLGYAFWKQRFDSDPGIVGKQVKLNGKSATVIGVAPEGFHGLYSLVEMNAYLPMGVKTLWGPNDDFWTKRDARLLKVYGVLAPGVSRKEAQGSVDVVMQRLAQNYPENKDFSARIYPEWLARPEPDPSNGTVIAGLLFMGLAGLVLLVACTNVANIVLVRATGRAREMAVRAALGASRLRLSRQLLTESIVLGLAGGAAGLLLGSWISNMLSSIDLEIMGSRLRFDFSLDWRVFLFGLTAAVLTGILVGLWPAFRVSRSDLNKVLHEGSRGILAGTGRSIARSVLVVVQVAVSLALLVVAGLFVRSTRNAERTYFGFDPSHVLNLIMDARNVGFDEQRSSQFYRELEDRIKVLPGVENVSLATSIPMGYANEAKIVYVEGKTANTKEATPTILCNEVTVDYFATMRIPLLHGRIFNKQDTDKSPRVAIVNEAMAKRFWPNEDPIGKTFRINAADGPVLQVVGLARQGKYTSPTDDAVSFFYLPSEQEPSTIRTLQIRTATAPEALIPDAERVIHELAPGLPLVGVESMERSLEGGNGLFLFRMGARFAGALGLLGLILALVGVYGVISYAAAQRTHEIGVRMALGADRGNILKMVLRQGFILVGLGVAVGLVITFGATRLIANFLVGVSPSDPLTFAVVTIVLAAVGLMASLIPARRAMKVEPLRALKYE